MIYNNKQTARAEKKKQKQTQHKTINGNFAHLMRSPEHIVQINIFYVYFLFWDDDM